MKKTLLLLFLSFNSYVLLAQAEEIRTIHDPFYDDKKVHFGFLFGGGSSSFDVTRSSYFASSSSTVSIFSPNNFTFYLGGLANIKLNDRFDFRSGINIALYSREVKYQLTNFQSSPGTVPFTGTVSQFRETTWLEVPVLLRYKSIRRENNRMFFSAGLKFGMEANVQQARIGRTRLSTKNSDVSLEYGFGLEHFFHFFKLSPEIRFSHGIDNIFIPVTISSTDTYARGIGKLTTNSVTLYLTFE